MTTNLLLIHNEYGKFSGEEAAFYSQVEVLQKSDYKVSTYVKTSSCTPKGKFAMVRALVSGVFSFSEFYKVYKLVKTNKIDIVHFHNIYPWLSISSLIAAKLLNAKVVLTLHNFKHICPSSTLTHNGKLYLQSLRKGAYVTVLDNVQGNIFKSIGYYLRFLSERLFKLEKIVDKFIFVSEMQSDIYKSYNRKFTNKSVVIPNFLTASKINEIQRYKYQKNGKVNIGFVGRLSQDKGFDLFISIAQKLNKFDFYAYGASGADLHLLPKNLNIVGELSQSDLFIEYSKLDILIIPSKNYETFSLAALEGLAAGLNVIVTNKVGISSYFDKFKTLYVADKFIDICLIVETIATETRQNNNVAFNNMFTEKGYLEMISKTYGGLN
ncbi:MAG: glycosyltransferase family 4 protein [Colwellia sp.]|nr:glycosyltransferase family 4 protein [Colwellia sp.]MCW9082880.1 glycosyltransferase family 4 protein [Colwellia sp.]